MNTKDLIAAGAVAAAVCLHEDHVPGDGEPHYTSVPPTAGYAHSGSAGRDVFLGADISSRSSVACCLTVE